MDADLLRTARLELSIPTMKDAAEIRAIAGAPRAVAHNPSELLSTSAAAEELVDLWIRHWHEKGYGYWCVREGGKSRVVGYCGIKAMTTHGQPVLNLMYRFAPDVWGLGYATEAASAAVAWARTHRPDQTIIARVRPANLASQKVALKVGLQRDPAMDDQGEDGLDLAFTNRRGSIDAPECGQADVAAGQGRAGWWS